MPQKGYGRLLIMLIISFLPPRTVVFFPTFVATMSKEKDHLLGLIRSGQPMSLRQQVKLTLLLCAPAVLAQVATILLQFIDTAMVGSLGAGPSASIGLVATTTWILAGFCMATSQGFSVQVAHLVGSNDFVNARKVMRQGLTSVLLFSLLIMLIGLSVSGGLPRWLGGQEDILEDAAGYFRIFCWFIPTMQVSFFAGSMLQCSGNMKVPSLLNIFMCVLDALLNFFLIFPTRAVSLAGLSFTLPGAGMGVRGAALGTGLAEAITALLMLYFLLVRSKELGIRRERGSFVPAAVTLKNAFGITGPMWLQNVIMRGAHIASTVIIAPLGAVSIAANAFAITAESFCYMPGYGMGDAASTLVGQSLGARREDFARHFSGICSLLGMAMMSALAVVMYIFAPQIMSLLSNDAEVVALGARVLRIEAFAEAGYAAAIVAYGSCVGAGDTLVPSIINLGSMWLVRIVPAIFLTRHFGLVGYWMVMCVELNVRGIAMFLRTRGRGWTRKALAIEKT